MEATHATAGPVVVLAGSLDTELLEYLFVRDRLRTAGIRCRLVDTGVLGEPAVEADIDRATVAAAGGSDHAALVAGGDRSAAVTVMSMARLRCCAAGTSEGRSPRPWCSEARTPGS